MPGLDVPVLRGHQDWILAISERLRLLLPIGIGSTVMPAAMGPGPLSPLPALAAPNLRLHQATENGLIRREQRRRPADGLPQQPLQLQEQELMVIFTSIQPQIHFMAPKQVELGLLAFPWLAPLVLLEQLALQEQPVLQVLHLLERALLQ